MKRRINLDMDGTIADLYNPKTWEEKLRKLKDYQEGIFTDLKPLVDMDKLSLLGKEFDIVIITWLPMDVEEESQLWDIYCKEKLDWLKQHLKCKFGFIPLEYGTRKSNYGDGLLFDDNKEVRKDWGKGAYSNTALSKFINQILVME